MGHEDFWEYGHRQGHGRCLFVQIGDFHEGNYQKNLRDGPGTYYWKDGRQFVGTYEKDERQGHGKFTYPNGDVYEGNFDRGQRSGLGTFTFHNKTCQYHGSWKLGMYSGEGKLQWQSTRERLDTDADTIVKVTSQHRYEGNFEKGLFEGFGTEYENDELVRQGQWRLGKFYKAERATEPNSNEESVEEPEQEQQTSSDDSEQADAAAEEEEAPKTDGSSEGDEDKKSMNESTGDDDESKENVELPSKGEDDGEKHLKAPERESLAECVTSVEQNYDDQHLQWKRSLE